MHITCPECGFSREVPEDKLPKRAQLATCPKCATKFKFRDLPEEFDLSEAPDPAPREEAPPPIQPDSPGNLWDKLEQQTPGGQAQPEQTEQAEQASKPVKRMYLDTTRPGSTAETVSETPPLPPPGETPSAAPGSKPVKRMYLDATRPDAKAQSMDQGDDSAEQEQFQDNGADEPRVDVPFERLDEYGFFPGLFETIKRSLTAPRLFFGSMRFSGGIGKPIVFYLLMAEFYALMEMIWGLIGVHGLSDYLSSGLGGEMPVMVMGAEAFLGLLLMPIYFVVILLLWSGITHFFLTMARAGNRGFGGTLRATAYAASPLILTVIPMYGEIAGGIWNMVLTYIALKHIHGTTYGRITLAYIIMTLSFILFAVLLTFIAGGISPKI